MASLGNSFFSPDTLQYGYNVNTTVLNNFTVSAQKYKARGYFKHRFVHEKTKKQNKKKINEIRKTHHENKKKELTTPGIEFVQIIITIKKALDFVHLRGRTTLLKSW